MSNVPRSTAGAVFGEMHELPGPPACSLFVCVWTNGTLFAIENPVIDENVAPAAGPAPIRHRAVAARTMRARTELAPRPCLERQLGARPDRQPTDVMAVHRLGGVQLP